MFEQLFLRSVLGGSKDDLQKGQRPERLLILP